MGLRVLYIALCLAVIAHLHGVRARSIKESDDAIKKKHVMVGDEPRAELATEVATEASTEASTETNLYLLRKRYYIPILYASLPNIAMLPHVILWYSNCSNYDILFLVL